MHNTFPGRYPLTIYGSSHSDVLGIRIEGLAPSLSLCEADFEEDLARRRSGVFGTTTRTEEDVPQIVSRSPLDICFHNKDVRSGDYSQFTDHPRPGHADFVSRVRFGEVAPGGGIFSGRMTAPLVAAGVVFKKLLSGVSIRAEIVEIGGVKVDSGTSGSSAEQAPWREVLQQAASQGDSLGGVVQCVVEGVPVGVGEPFFDSIESVISHLVFSIPGVRGIEFGDGFAVSRMRGSEHNDPIVDASGHTSRNGAGGINGGLSNGNPIVFRVAFKPASSIAREQQTYNFASGEEAPLRCPGRHDTCYVLRTPVIVEAVTAIALAELI